MKKCFSRYRLALFALMIIPMLTFADQTWDDVFANNVVDEDLVIKGDVLLNPSGTYIEAIHRDVTVTLRKDATIRGNWSAPSQLYLVAARGRTIRFVVDHDLTFVGSSSIIGTDLLIVQSGPGTVQFAINSNRELSLTTEDGSGGVQMYVLMYGGQSAPNDEYSDEYSCAPNICPDEYVCIDEYSPGNGCNETGSARPLLLFTGNSFTRQASRDAIIRIGKKSLLSFLSSRMLDIANDSATIEFDPASNFNGRMVLDIHNKSAFLISGHFTSQRNGGAITLEDIDLSQPAGFNAIWAISNSQGGDVSSGLLVLNNNEKLFDLLVDPFLNLDTRNPLTDYKGAFSGKQYGVVLGANGTLWVKSDSFLDYVGLALNQVPDVDFVPGFNGVEISRLLKERNPSALFVDGNNNPLSQPAAIKFDPQSAVFFRSGAPDNGDKPRGLHDVDPFTVDPAERTKGVGNIVFDVEGQLNVNGPEDSMGTLSKIELLSLEVIPSGGSLFVGSGNSGFPLRTFNTEDDELLTYNTGAFLINNILALHDTSLSHTDVNHQVFPNNDTRSEPAYIGGETFKLLNSPVRPSIQFFNSRLLLNSDLATTGVDLAIPNLVDDEGVLHQNVSDFVFYSNGACIDNGTGRQLILGTRIGSTAIDGCSRIDSDSHLDIIELYNSVSSDVDPTDPEGDQTLKLTTQFNDATINDLDDQPGTASIHTIFLGGSSNISIGVNADTTGFNIDTHPWLRIQGNFFSFESKGGRFCPDVSNITGKGGIFVDLNGKLSIDPGFMASFCVMITKSHNAIVDLPPDQVFFCEGVGIAEWDVNLTTPEGQILVPAGQEIANFVFNWIIAKKDCANFTPFQVGDVGVCGCPPVTEQNVSSLPTIEGTVDNLIIQDSRFGDPAEILINGGVVRNIEFQHSACSTNLSGQAPVAIIVLDNEGQVTIPEGANLGVNGITIIANGPGIVNITGSVNIGAHCAIVRGPDFMEGDVLTINATVPSEIRVSSSGTLDLRSFNNLTDLLQFTGDVNLILEPGATIIVGEGTTSFGGNTQINFEPALTAPSFFQAIPHGAHDPALDPLAVVDAAEPHNQLAGLINFGEGLHNTDAFRVRIMGEGTIELRDNAVMSIPNNAFVGVETVSEASCEIATTNFNLVVRDNAQVHLGQTGIEDGGVLQIGDVENNSTVKRAIHTVSFKLTLDGNNAVFSIGSKGFFGLGLGIERYSVINEAGEIVPNEDIVDTLFNVASITLEFINGRFEHNSIASGDSPQGSLLAISGAEQTLYSLIFQDPELGSSSFNIAGGGNMVLIFPGEGGLHPVVLDQAGMITPRLSVGILASSLLQADQANHIDITGQELFDILRTHDAVLETNRDNTIGLANAATSGENLGSPFDTMLVDTVSQGVILRTSVFDIIGTGTEDSKQQGSIKAGAVAVNINPATNQILTATIIPGV